MTEQPSDKTQIVEQSIQLDDEWAVEDLTPEELAGLQTIEGTDAGLGSCQDGDDAGLGDDDHGLEVADGLEPS